ncbi:MAG: dual specificity protein phosphatase family protein [Actinomycetota bacterium]|nr:dual specificity protein phosphatase family protein [Actinomycetota bacterium]
MSSIARNGPRVAAAAGAFVLLPNLAIALLHRLGRRAHPGPPPRLPMVNFAEVDERLWRGAAPSEVGLEALAADGVATVVDLRAEKGIEPYDALRNRLGIDRVHIPLRDGQAPTPPQVERFLDAVARSPGRVFVHCGAGVGRTGTMAAAYLVSTGQATREEAVARNLSVGPPSIEQLAFSAMLAGHDVRRPRAPVVAYSRVVDGPRRFWARARALRQARTSLWAAR